MEIVNRALAFAQQAPVEYDRWRDEFLGLEQDQRFVVVLVAIGCTTAVVITLVAIIAGVTSGIHRRRHEVEFKREMLDRGMSPEEIAQVIESTPLPEDGFGRMLANWGKHRK